ncbi:MAG: VCBS repeat-containing protein [Saprospiraceae bacterium]|nr:VCBS repeat-containing protein [Saprospiraceae bacterium]
MNIIQYLYYYNGGGVATGDVNGDDLPDLYFTSNLGADKLYLNRGNFKFEEATEKAGITQAGSWKTGVTMADVNADGLLDIYVCEVGDYKKFKGKNRLFINLGADKPGGIPRFEEKAAEYGLDLKAFATQAAFFDVDADGDLDCFVACHSVHSAGSYRDTSLTRKYDPLAADRLFRNEGNGKFTDVSRVYGIYGGTAGYALGLVVSDVNGDGRPDVYIGNDFHENDYLYLNRDGKRFEETAAKSFGHQSNFTMGCDVADVNNDGRADLVSLDMKPPSETLLKASQPVDAYDVFTFKHSQGYHWQFPRNNLQLNRGQAPDGDYPLFSEIGQLAGVDATDWSWSALFTDLDLDGHKDLYITNGIVRRPNDMDYLKFISSKEVQRNATDLQLIEKMPRGDVPNACFQNRGNLGFSDVAATWGLAKNGFSNGAVYADLDNDGDPDLVTNNLNAPASVYQNKGNGNKALKIMLKGDGKNPFAIGARVWVWQKGKMQYAENQPTRGFQSSVEPGMLLFGLGKDSLVDSLVVAWPDGRFSKRNNIVVRGKAEVLQSGSGSVFSASQKYTAAAGLQYLRFATTDNTYADNAVEKLIPWYLSTQGPELAVADLDGDGLEDIIVAGYHVRWYKQTAQGQWLENNFEAVSDSIEAVTVEVFDVNNDGLPDVFLGTGGYEVGDKIPNRDYLLTNLGKGQFSQFKYQLKTSMTLQTSCARAADVNGDGYQDLFVGGRGVEGVYGMPGRSRLLLNDGHDLLYDMTETWSKDLAHAGMVTDARWADVNADGKPDLITVGEWMQLTVWYNREGYFEKMALPATGGFWQTVVVSDVDGDGDPDFLAGNLGLNSVLSASPKEPLGLWLGDFDGNGASDPLITWYRQGRHVLFADKDLLVSQMPSLRKDFVEYRKYAEAKFDDVFPAEKQKKARHFTAEMLESVWVENLGGEKWAVHVLPVEAQFSTVFAILPMDWDGDGQDDYLLGGNFYEVMPAIGRLDASYGALLLNKKGVFKNVEPVESGLWLRGPVRDLKNFGKKGLVVGGHGGGVEVLQ